MTLTKRPILEFARRHKMTRWRILKRSTGEVVELSSQSFEGACHFLKWKPAECIGVNEGKQSILLDPKWYVRPNLSFKRG